MNRLHVSKVEWKYESSLRYRGITSKNLIKSEFLGLLRFFFSYFDEFIGLVDSEIMTQMGRIMTMIPSAVFQFNMSYLTDSYIVFTLKMESQSLNIIFGLNMMVKSGLEKIVLNSLSLHAGRWLFLLPNLWFWEFYEAKKNSYLHGGISK